MELQLPLDAVDLPQPDHEWLTIGARRVRLWLVPNRKARRYVLRLRADGSARVAIPRGGSAAEARRFAERNTAWIERQLLRQALSPRQPEPWILGGSILFRGKCTVIEREATPVGVPSAGGRDVVRLGDQSIRVKDVQANLRLELERHLWQLAARELPPRVLELAGAHGFRVGRVMVRNQRSRWGSCSRRGAISLNWRLIQTPPEVRDYIILHELAHLEQMNHSIHFWRVVARLCPGFRQAERWLKENARLLR